MTAAQRRAMAFALLCLLFAAPVFAEGQIKTGDIVCFGAPDENCGYDGKWLVLDDAATNTGEPGMFLLSLNLIGSEDGEELIFRQIGDVSVGFFNRGERFAEEHPGSQTYQGSEIQSWCADFLESHFSEAEQAAIFPTYKSDAAAVIPGLGIPLPGAMSGTVDFDPVENILNGDKLFLLSAEEAYNEAYGFTDDKSRIALYKGDPAGYWLRSPHMDTFPLDVGFVFSFGTLMDYPVNGQFLFHMSSYARPALNLDRSRISDSEALAQEGDITIWRISFQDGERNTRDYDISLPVIGDTIDLKAMARRAFAAVIVAIAVLITVITCLIVRRKCRKRAMRG